MRPSNIIYALNDRIPSIIGVFLGLQHVSVIAIAFVFPVMLVREIGGTTEQAAFMVSMSMLAGGIGVLVQALPRIGSGYLCPQVCGPSFLATSIIAAKTGGLPLVFGLNLFAGLLEALFSRVLHRLRFLFPAEVTGLIISLVGITVIKVAGSSFLGLDQELRINPQSLWVGGLTLSIMVALNVWTKGKLKLFCVLIGMVSGYLIAVAFGALTVNDLKMATAGPLFWIPFQYHPGWAFDISLALPLLIAVLCSSLKTVGDLTTCQKINDSSWKRPDMQNIRRGILADAVGCLAAGVVGGMGQSSSSANIGLSIATGATSRRISYFIAAILIALAFFPKLGFVLAVMPRPVVGATLIFAVSFMIVAGMQIVMSRMSDSRKTFVIGLSLIFSLLADMVPEAFMPLPPLLRVVFSSSLSVGALSAVILNLIFRIGIHLRATVVIDHNEDISQQVFDFFGNQGGQWGARPEVLRQAASAVSQYLDGLAPEGDVRLEATFDELQLGLVLTHDGESLLLDARQPTPEELLESDDAHRRLAGFLVKFYADDIKVRRKSGKSEVVFKFEH